MSSPVEDRLREALAEAGASLDASTLRPLRAPERRRFQVDFRLVAAAAVVVVLGGAAVGLGGAGDEDRAVAANPPSPATEASVFLCATSTPKESPCEGRNITPLQTKAVEAELKRLPQIETVRYVDQSVAYAAFRRSFAHNQALLDEVKVTDLPAAFRVKISAGTDLRQLNESLRRVAGIHDVAVGGTALQASEMISKWDISVFLCQKGSSIPECGAKLKPRDDGDFLITKEGKGTTTAQRKAVLAVIEDMPEVESYVFEDRATAFENFRRAYRDNKTLLAATRVEDMPESFRLKLKEEEAAAEGDVVAELRRQAGVGRVISGQCSADRAALTQNFGLILPESKVCPVGK
ncbi:permease-like cell division protein FtsX [Nonomuraea terrae]|uniref:permease-like cell division protein FtsX n=1 Tax=Nonomuraea terrae TaxID=2530383 RepID=UPI00378BC116